MLTSLTLIISLQENSPWVLDGYLGENIFLPQAHRGQKTTGCFTGEGAGLFIQECHKD
jgi:hypothetical protein